MTASVPKLQTLYAYLTSGCNCACRHCWIVAGARPGSGTGHFLDPGVARRAIEQALPLGLTSIKWTGGEPTLHPGFEELLTLQKEFGLAGTVETNGLLVSPRLAAHMRESGIDSVSVSLDGATAATHEAIRGIKGGFDRTLAGISALAGTGYRPELILTLQRSNLGELADYLLLAQQIGAGQVKLNVVQPLLKGADLEEQGETLSVAELLSVAGRLAAKEFGRFDIPVSLDLPPAFRPLGKIVSGEEAGMCNILQILGLLPRGEYALCGIGEHIAELSMGKVMAQPLAKVWLHHPVLNALRSGLPERLDGVCAECLMQGACRGNCIAANYHLGRDLFAAYWFCQRAHEQGLFPRNRMRHRS